MDLTPRDVEKKTEKESEAVNDRPYLAGDDAAAFPTLADSELAVLAALGTRRPVTVGEYLYRRGADHQSPGSWALPGRAEPADG